MKANTNTVEKLNELLADLQISYQNLRTIHWLVKGPEFFMLHKLYEKLYNEMAEVIDEVAERILMIGGTPLHQFDDYLKFSSIEPVNEVPSDRESLTIAIDNFNRLLTNYKTIIEISTENKDEGTTAMLSKLIENSEKHIWMMNNSL